VVTNQSGVARGLFSGPDVDRVHARVRDLLAAEGAAVDRFLVCPHHPDFTGPCACRKPGTGLLLQGAAELGVDLRRSWTIGDTLEDLLAGDRGGTRTILVRTGYGAGVERDRSASLPPGAVVEDDLAGAVARVLGGA
jgi:D-glycero-D-manno-heptose 1,7-bisphosphate phosphatase